MNKPVLNAFAAPSVQVSAHIGWAVIAVFSHFWRQAPSITLVVLLVRHRALVAEGAP